jgi:hypothetical protein
MLIMALLLLGRALLVFAFWRLLHSGTSDRCEDKNDWAMQNICDAGPDILRCDNAVDDFLWRIMVTNGRTGRPRVDALWYNVTGDWRRG